MTTIKVLLLDDKLEDFKKLEAAINSICKSLEGNSIQLELLYDQKKAKKLIANFVAYKELDLDLRRSFKEEIENMVNMIKKEELLICIIDIMWGNKKANEYGIDFYGEFLNEENRSKNTVIATILDTSKIPEKIGNIKPICKNQKKIYMGDEFIKKLSEIIYNMPIVKNNINDFIGNNKPKLHTEVLKG
jgi:hypothetical protein